MDRLKERIHEILDKAQPGDRTSRTIDRIIMALIVLNVVVVILETVESVSTPHRRFFEWFEAFSVGVFTIEYLMRMWSCTADTRFARPVLGRLRYFLTPLALVDLIAILPFYLPLVTSVDMRVLRAMRLLRLFKLGRYSTSLQTLGNVLRKHRGELLVTLFVLLIMLVIASTLMYFAEHHAQPDAFSSIPSAMWWGIVTLTTVGYGDTYPVTGVGRVLGAVIALLGIGMFALPAGILGSGFAEEIDRKKKEGGVCPHCGREMEE